MVFKWILICLWAQVLPSHGRPEAPYHYPVPSPGGTNFLPNRNFVSASTAQASFNVQQNNAQNAALSQNYLPTTHNAQQSNFIPSTSYGTPILNSANFVQSNAVIPNRNYGSPDLLLSNQSPVSAFSAFPQPANVQKHIYIHVAPPDVEEQRHQQQQQAIAQQKHYKIIFIKAPSYQTRAQQIAQQQAQHEEKTLIYVLVKKPEEQVEVNAQQLATNQVVNKPEVYFIKYKAKSESSVQNQNVENTQHLSDNDSVVVESAAKAANRDQNGYSYNKPSVLK